MQRALFSADLRQYSEDCEEPERYDPDETIRVIVEMKAAPAYEVASTASTDALKSAETAALKGQEATIQAVRKQLGLEPVHRTACLVNMVTYDIRRGDVKSWKSCPVWCPSQKRCSMRSKCTPPRIWPMCWRPGVWVRPAIPAKV